MLHGVINLSELEKFVQTNRVQAFLDSKSAPVEIHYSLCKDTVFPLPINVDLLWNIYINEQGN